MSWTDNCQDACQETCNDNPPTFVRRILVFMVVCLILFVPVTTDYFIFLPWLVWHEERNLFYWLAPFNLGVVLILVNYGLTIVTSPGEVPRGFSHTDELDQLWLQVEVDNKLLSGEKVEVRNLAADRKSGKIVEGSGNGEKNGKSGKKNKNKHKKQAQSQVQQHNKDASKKPAERKDIDIAKLTGITPLISIVRKRNESQTGNTEDKDSNPFAVRKQEQDTRSQTVLDDEREDTPIEIIPGDYKYTPVPYDAKKPYFLSVPLPKETNLTHLKEYIQSKLYPRYCESCKNYKPPRTHHSSSEGKCILMMDHFCPWINNCVGFGNQGHFYRFLAAVVWSDFSCLTLLGLRLIDLAHYQNQMDDFGSMLSTSEELFYTPPINEYEIVFLVINLLILFGLLLTVGVLFLFQTFYILDGTTTVEVHENGKIQNMLEKKRFTLPDGTEIFPYNLGWYHNICRVLGRNPLLWFCPFVKPDGDGLHFRIAKEVNALEFVQWPPKEYYLVKNGHTQLKVEGYDDFFMIDSGDEELESTDYSSSEDEENKTTTDRAPLIERVKYNQQQQQKQQQHQQQNHHQQVNSKKNESKLYDLEDYNSGSGGEEEDEALLTYLTSQQNRGRPRSSSKESQSIYAGLGRGAEKIKAVERKYEVKHDPLIQALKNPLLDIKNYEAHDSDFDFE